MEKVDEEVKALYKYYTLIDNIGFIPKIEHCSNCKEKLLKNERVFRSFYNEGFVCYGCFLFYRYNFLIEQYLS